MPKKSTTKGFIIKSRIIHGDRYGYSLVEYINNITMVKITCKKHGVFEQIPKSHIKGHGCNKCIKYKCNKVVEDVIYNFKKKHGKKYNYDLVEYNGNKVKVKIICPIHGVFNQRPNDHLNGSGCPKCTGKNKTTDEFINECKKIHGDAYDYSLTEYNGSKKKVKIICPIHGIFEQLPTEHVSSSSGCPKCTGKNKTTDEFINECKKIHGDAYDYSLVDYINSKTKIIITCPIHGVFNQLPSTHLSGSGCPICKSSKGEIFINEYLTKNGILFESQKSFTGCKHKQLLKFDFYLPDHNLCIEYDGRQHFEAVDYFGGEEGLNNTQLRDKIKNEYCNVNDIHLLRIRYDDNILLSLEERQIIPHYGNG